MTESIFSNGHVLVEQTDEQLGDTYYECEDCGYASHSVEDVSAIDCRDFSESQMTSKDVAWDTILHMVEHYDAFSFQAIKEEFYGIPAGTSRRTLYRTLSVAVELEVLEKRGREYVVV